MSYSEQLQRIVKKYESAGNPFPATAHDIAQWAIEQKLWEPQRSTLVDRCAEELARAMREEYITDQQGRRVRVKHVATIENNGKQAAFWADMRKAPRNHMVVAFQQRRQQIVGDCRQLKSDMDSYNQNYNVGEPIQMVFDFTLDIEEIEALRPLAA
jgi:multidrug efflux pump subunit AcrB